MKNIIIPLLLAFFTFILLKFFYPINRDIVEENVIFSMDTGNETHYETIQYDTTFVDENSGDTITETITKMAPHRPSTIEYDKKSIFNITIEFPEVVRQNEINDFKLTILRDSTCLSQQCNLSAFLRDPYELLKVENIKSIDKEVKNGNTWLWSFLPLKTSRLELYVTNKDGGFKYEKEVLVEVTNGFWGSILIFIRENPLVTSTLIAFVTFFFNSMKGRKKKTENNA